MLIQCYNVNHYNHHKMCGIIKIVEKYFKFLKILSSLQGKFLCYLSHVIGFCHQIV
jgi:hypothetical protein